MYVHIPFCRKICTYCDFPKLVAPLSYQREYIDLLIQEIRHYHERLPEVRTVYIGGGTPSGLEPGLLDTLLSEISRHVLAERLQEYTVEFNPEDITPVKVEIMKKHHVSRISVGVETFNPALAMTIGRSDPTTILASGLEILRNNNITNYSFDLLYGLPGQKAEAVAYDLDKALSLEPKHISYYSLILEPRTKLEHDWRNHLVSFPDEEELVKMSDLIDTRLDQSGFKRYEISNYAKEGYESKHNLIYWRLEEYLGLGMGASSQIDNRRFHNARQLKAYMESVRKQGSGYEADEPFEPDKELVMLGLRLVEGLEKGRFEARFKLSIFERFPDMKVHLLNGLLQEDDQRIWLSKRGMDLSNYVLSSLF